MKIAKLFFKVISLLPATYLVFTLILVLNYFFWGLPKENSIIPIRFFLIYISFYWVGYMIVPTILSVFIWFALFIYLFYEDKMIFTIIYIVAVLILLILFIIDLKYGFIINAILKTGRITLY